MSGMQGLQFWLFCVGACAAVGCLVLSLQLHLAAMASAGVLESTAWHGHLLVCLCSCVACSELHAISCVYPKPLSIIAGGIDASVHACKCLFFGCSGCRSMHITEYHYWLFHPCAAHSQRAVEVCVQTCVLWMASTAPVLASAIFW